MNARIVTCLCAMCCAAALAADLAWIDLAGTNRPPAGVSSASSSCNSIYRSGVDATQGYLNNAFRLMCLCPGQ